MTVNDGYILGRDATENERLRWQNGVLLQILGFTVHPLILTRLGKNLHVAEIASGPGTFLIGLAKELDPASTIEGTDISDTAWEAYSDELPANVEMRVADAKAPAAEERRGRYDLVCVRFMNVANRPEDWARVAEHAFQLLRPGGALQWVEGDFLQSKHLLYTHPNTKTSAAKRVYDKTFQSENHWDYFVTNLAPILRETGFREVRQEVVSTDRVPEMRKAVSQMGVGAEFSVLREKQRVGAESMSVEEVEALRAEVLEEVEAGAYFRFDIHAFVAFK